MALTTSVLLDPVIDAFTMAIVGVSLYYIAKQKRPEYPYVKSLLFVVNLFFEVLLSLEIIRNLVSSQPFLDAYAFAGTTLILWDAVFLTLIAYAVYARPGGRGVLGRLRYIFLRWPHGLVLSVFLFFTLATMAYLGIAHPYSIVSLDNLIGAPVPSIQYSAAFLTMLLGILFFFLAYPTLLLIRAANQVRDPDTRRALIILPACWLGIGADLMLFNGYLVTRGFELSPVGYAIAAVSFAITASIFRRKELITTFFSPVAEGQRPARGAAGSGFLSEDGGVTELLEVDPTTDYESVVASFVSEGLSKSSEVHVFTSKGSPVYRAVSKQVGVKVYVLTTKVSYPKASERQGETLVPQNDQAVLLDLIEKSSSSAGSARLYMVVDSITDLILSLGFEGCYKFLKQANEILSRQRVSALFLLTGGAHDDKVVSLTKSLFSLQLAYDRTGLRGTRSETRT